MEVTEKNPFCEPWEGTDLILFVEDEKFHVHRQILGIHSPVFKAMLNSQFKEGTAADIPLPGKKANEVLDFLKVLYLKEQDGLTCEYENIYTFKRLLKRVIVLSQNYYMYYLVTKHHCGMQRKQKTRSWMSFRFGYSDRFADIILHHAPLTVYNYKSYRW